MENERILVVDDEEGLLQLVKMRLTAMGFGVTGCTTGRDAIDAAKKNRFDLAITDLRLGSEDGLDVTEELLRIHPGLPVIILTAHGSIPNAVEAMQRGPSDISPNRLMTRNSRPRSKKGSLRNG